MTPDDPRHGEYRGWQAHAKDDEDPCGPCVLAAYRYHKQKHIRRSKGIINRVTLGEKAHAIIRDNPRRALSLSTGIPSGKLGIYLRGGPDKPVLRSTRERIERFSPHGVPTPLGIQRRVRALNRLGYSAQAIAEAAGCHVESVKDVRRAGHTPRYVKTDFAERIVACYERLSMTLPEPSRGVSKARGYAIRHGWSPPLAYDDIDLDEAPVGDPTRLSATARANAERAATLRDLDTWGENVTQACRRLGVNRAALERWCHRHELADLYSRLVERETYREPVNTFGGVVA